MSKKFKKFLVRFFKCIVKYVLPVILAWIEGDSHALQDGLTNLLSIISEFAF